MSAGQMLCRVSLQQYPCPLRREDTDRMVAIDRDRR